MPLPYWVLTCAGQEIDEETFATMTLEQQSWWLETVRSSWEVFFDDAD